LIFFSPLIFLFTGKNARGEDFTPSVVTNSAFLYKRETAIVAVGVAEEQMKILTEYIAKALVEAPDQVEVTQSRQGSRVRLELKVSKDDMGRVIGKSGRVANAIRVLLRVAAEREGQQVTLDVVEP
jgi:predicted RNA-binding protein YlqC (UPF0109 family)